ncbi:MAG TPA: MFS transporter [Streptosporangiaceae bacterium]|nr:MFS transporter [Streptosporangiaceae bacterium]
MLAIASLGGVIAFVDATIVNIAFPDITRSFPGASISALSWVLNAYNVVFAAFLMAGAGMADSLGRRRVFVVGLELFTAGSLLCAFAPSAGALIAFRVVQALGAAMLVPSAVALVLQAFPPARRSHAVALLSAVSAAAAGLGPSLGGLLVTAANWRLVFLVNVPIGVAAVLLARRRLAESRAPGRHRIPDLPGTLLFASAIGALVLGIVQGQQWGWGSAPILGCLAGALTCGAVVVWRCTWHRSPVIDLTLLKIRTVSVANAMTVIGAAGFYGYTLSNVLFLTGLWRYSVLQAGLALTAGPVVAVAVAGPASRLAQRIGPRPVLVAGGLVWGGAVLWFVERAGMTPDLAGQWLPGIVLLGIGAGTLFPTLSGTAVGSAPGGSFATATGMNSVARQIGAALGVAIVVAVIGTPTPATAYAAFQHAWMFGAVCLFAAGLGCVLVGPATAGQAPAPADAAPAALAETAPQETVHPACPGPRRVIALDIAGPSVPRPKPQLSPAGNAAPATIEAVASDTRRPGTRRGLVGRRTAGVAVSALVVTVAAVLALALLPGNGSKPVRLTGDQAASWSQPLAAAALGTYPGQQNRGVFQAISRIVASNRTIVATGWLTSDDTARQQFFVSIDGGESWHLAPVRAPGGGQAPLGYAATRLAGGPSGWLAVGPQAVWTSPDGLSWTLAATHGITRLPGDGVWVLTSTARGFLAAGAGAVGESATQAVIWTSRNGVTWQRTTAAQLGLARPGETVESISYATSRGQDTVISGAVTKGGTTYSGAWLSTDGGSTWSRVTVPVDHGAGTSITGLGFDGSGLIAVRPGQSANGTGDGVIYFSPNGRIWRYAATIDPAGGWSPSLVKGSDFGFVVAGTSAAGQIVAYRSTGTGTTWQPTAPLGDTADESVASATVGAGDTVLAVGSTAASPAGQQPVFIQATTVGAVRPVPLASIPGVVIRQVAVNALASAGGQQIAVGSADGYPAIWRKARSGPGEVGGGSWALVSSLSLVAGEPGLAALTSVTHGPAGWLAVGVPGPVVYTSADGTTWQPAPVSIARDLAGVTSVAATAGPHGYIIAGQLVAPGGACVADVWWSPNLASWTRARDVNDVGGSSQVAAVAADAHGFVSVGSHNGQPAVWTSTNGTAWTTIALALPPGTTGVLRQVAINGDRVAALGEQTVAGVSTPLVLAVNGGASWIRVPFIPPGPDAAITALTADAGGFTAAVQSGQPGQQHVTVWTSADGASWTQMRLGGLSGGGIRQLTALASSGTTVTGIGSIATPYSQQPVTWTFPAR